ESRMLDRRQFLDCFAKATSIAMPSQLVADLAAESTRSRPRYREVLKDGPSLSYKRTAEINPDCVQEVLASRKPVQISYSDDISEAISKLHERDRRPEEFFRQIPRFRDLTDPGQREKIASEFHARNAKLLRTVTALTDENEKDLGLLIEY